MGSSCYPWLEPFALWLTTSELELYVTKNDISWLTSVVELSGTLTPLLSANLMDWWGRKTVLLLIGPITFVSWLFIAYFRRLFVFYLMRVVQGIVLDTALVSVPMYITEISSIDYRGTFGAHSNGFMHLGFLYAYLMNYFLHFRYYIYSLSILPVIFFFTFIFMPETPYYCLMRKNKEKAIKSLNWFRGGCDIVKELKEIEEAVAEDMKNKGGIRDVFATKCDRRSFFIVLIVHVTTSLNGKIVLVIYAGQIFSTTSLLWLTPQQFAIIMGAVLCFSSFSLCFLPDIVGRRPLLIISSIGITTSNLVISIYYFLHEKVLLDRKTPSLSCILYIAVLNLCIFSDIGLNQLLFTIQGEFFPNHTRAIGGALVSSIVSLATFISLKIYQPITENFGIYMNFLIYGINSFLGTILIIKYVTESAGKSLYDINKEIRDATSG